ncbi:MAG: hypothetical protein HY000_17195 [Planctomycetes bacterium]|nr:hypothetical protein [Planctomycetota bacterium]
MHAHILNCFEITNASALRMDYRLVAADGPFDPELGDGDLADRNLQQLVKRIQFQEKIPVAIERSGPQPLLAIPADHTLTRLEYELTPDVATLAPRDDVGQLHLGDRNNTSDRIALSFLSWYLRSPLFRDNRLWSSGALTYFNKRPLNYHRDDRDIDVYRGFGFRLARVDGRLCVWVRLAHRYVEARWLLDSYDPQSVNQQLRMRHVLYHFGHQWFPVQLMGITGRTIGEHTFVPEGGAGSISIFDYTLREARGKKMPAWIESLDANTAAVLYRYPGNEKRRLGAAALCKLLVPTEDPRVRGVHELSILDPAQRFRETRGVVEAYLQRAAFGETPICLRPAPLQVEPKMFAIPAQEFGQGKLLRVGRDLAKGEVPLKDFAKKRMDLLLDPEGGFAVNTPLDAQCVIVPARQERKVAEDFQQRLEKTVCSLIKRAYSFTRVVYDDNSARTLKQQVDAITAALSTAGIESGRGVLMLPARAQPDLHNLLKRKLGDRFQLQCVTAQKVRQFYEVRGQNGTAIYSVSGQLASRYVSYLRNTAMGLLLVNRQWPWVLPDGTHYDMYIAIDVLYNTAAFTFFSQGGRQCFVRTVRSEQSEKLRRRQVRMVVYENLRNELKGGVAAPRSLVVARDGRAYRSEWLGFRDAIEQLKGDGLLPADVVYGMVEVHKSTAEGIRLVEEPQGGALRNPRIGSWAVLNDKEGIVCTTGFPFRFRGTADPLLVRVSAGELKLPYVLEDAFRKSLLCWPKPDGFIRLGIDHKLCDDNLRALASEADDDEAQFGEDETGEAAERHAAGWNA